MSSRAAAAPLRKLTTLCGALPETTSARHGTHAAFRVRGKVFCYYLDNHHGDGVTAVCCKAAMGENVDRAAREPKRFYLPAYLGHRGWFALRLEQGRIDWAEVQNIVKQSYRLVAPKTLLRALDGAATPAPRRAGRRAPGAAALICLGLLFGVAAQSPSSAAPTTPAGHPLLGEWQLAGADRACREWIEFRADGTSRSASAGARAEGEFIVSARPLGNGRYELTANLTHSNGAPDCYGDIAPLGIAVTSYVQIYPGDRLFFCPSATSTDCYGPYARRAAATPRP